MTYRKLKVLLQEMSMQTRKFAWVDNFARLSMRICDYFEKNFDEDFAP